MAMQSHLRPSGCQTLPDTLLSLAGAVTRCNSVQQYSTSVQQFTSPTAAAAAVGFMGDFHPVLEDAEAAVNAHFQGAPPPYFKDHAMQCNCKE